MLVNLIHEKQTNECQLLQLFTSKSCTIPVYMVGKKHKQNVKIMNYFGRPALDLTRAGKEQLQPALGDLGVFSDLLSRNEKKTEKDELKTNYKKSLCTQEENDKWRD